MECKFCGKKLIQLKRDWDTRKFHKTCYKKQRDIWFIDKQINNYRVWGDFPTIYANSIVSFL